MDAPISFRPGRVPPWPFTVLEFGSPVTASSGPSWVGDWQTPPPEVCDILTAAEWRIEFELDPSSFDPNADPITLDTTIKPGQIKRRIDSIVSIDGGDGFQTVEQIFTGNFQSSEDPPLSLTDKLFELSYFWGSPYVEDGEPVFGLFNEAQLNISLYNPRLGKNESDEWVWLFESYPESFRPLASYSAAVVDRSIPNPPIFPYAQGNVINFMGNQHAAPVAGFPVVSLSIVSHFGDD
jgi:hypothetical protein